jgi:hypothetical protein
MQALRCLSTCLATNKSSKCSTRAQRLLYRPSSALSWASASVRVPTIVRACSNSPAAFCLLRCVGILTSLFHPTHSRLFSLAGAPFILYFCFKSNLGGAADSGPRKTREQLHALLNDPTVSPNAKRKALSDEYTAVAEQYVKYGLAVGFMLAILWQFIGLLPLSSPSSMLTPSV